MNQKMFFRLSWAIAILALTFPIYVFASDYSSYTKAVLDKSVSWETAVSYIDNKIDCLEERLRAIESLVYYHSKGIVPYLENYAKNPEDQIRLAVFWPLYNHQRQEMALELLKHELERNNSAVAVVFYKPNEVETEYKLSLAKNDYKLHKIIEHAATDEKTDPWIRVHAAIHLVSIGKGGLAGEVAKRILKDTPPDPLEKDYEDWSEVEKRRWHLRERAKWCIELARQ